MYDSGQLGQHESALTILVHDLHDSTSAEAYCTLGGEVIPSKTAQALGERYELKEWAAVLVPAMAPTPGKKMSAASMSRLKTVDAGLKKELIGVLLKVYMSGGYVLLLSVWLWRAYDSLHSSGSRPQIARRASSTPKR